MSFGSSEFDVYNPKFSSEQSSNALSDSVKLAEDVRNWGSEDEDWWKREVERRIDSATRSDSPDFASLFGGVQKQDMSKTMAPKMHLALPTLALASERNGSREASNLHLPDENYSQSTEWKPIQASALMRMKMKKKRTNKLRLDTK